MKTFYRGLVTGNATLGLQGSLTVSEGLDKLKFGAPDVLFLLFPSQRL